ncbi:Protein phosphatase Slingshot-like protein [Venturia nashicola]|uniref:Protein phosphatase Slingshot-like protein n=1 Tax=Venturia nashicola TaxID=86259 RepID=A0A4Z1PR81_9PEZI|nr:Protein phosphatase Slingshot-like protein [Venturia nashicola]TLD37445.1 Protein phosphatase Slingshot-like protein [Venturia nashicola]
METPTEPPRVSSSRSKKRSWPKKYPKKPHHQRPKNPTMGPSNITFSVTPNVNGKHSPRQPQPADEHVKWPEGPTKVFPINSENSSRRKKNQPSTASGVKVERSSAMTSEFGGSLSTKNCNPKHSKSSKERVKDKVMEDPEVFPASFSATVELVDLFSDHSPQELQAFAPETLQKRASSSKQKEGKKKSLGLSGRVPLVRLPKIASVCQSPRTANVFDLDVLPSHQHSSAGALPNAQIPTLSPKGKQKLDEKSSDLATQALVLENRHIVSIKPYRPRKLALIDEDAEPVPGESSSGLQTLQRSTIRTKGQKRNKKRSNQPACQVQSLQNHPSPLGPTARAEMAKNLTQIFAAHQLLVTRNRSHKAVASRKKFPFLRLPRELRDIIIDYTIDYEGIDSMLVKINSSFPFTYVGGRKFNEKLQEWMTELDGVCFRSTPTVLLLNKQIYEEAQEILGKKPLRISHPPQYPIKRIYDSSHVISGEALSKVTKIQFELQTYPATERKRDVMQPDWKGASMYRDEFLENSYPWAMLLKDCFQFWRGTQEARYLEFSIDHCSGGTSQFNLAVFGEKMLAFEDCIDAVLESHDLDALMGFLMFADAPIDFI